jgi:ferredoxin--NADP+ reductase
MATESTSVPGTPEMPEVKMHLATPVKPCVGTVVQTHRCTASRKAAGFVRHVSIDVTGTPLAGNFVAGQSFGVIPPGIDATGKPHKLRLYSIASPTQGEDGQGNVLSTTVKRTIDEHWESHRLFLGVASNYLCDLDEGDQVTVTGPNGKRFVLPADPSAHDYLLVATGTGIAPFRGMVMQLLAAKHPGRIVLAMGSPYASDLLYHQDFTALAAANQNFRYLTAISRERQEDGGKPMYVHERLGAAGEELVPMLRSERTLIYVCGIAGMELGVMRTLDALLSASEREQYLRVDAAAGPREAWDRKMLNKALQPTRRMFLEVY